VDLEEKKVEDSFELPGDVVRAFQPLDGGGRWAVAMGSGAIALLESKSWKLEDYLFASRSPVHTLALLPGGAEGLEEVLVAGDASGRLTFWDVGKRNQLHETFALGEPITAIITGTLGTDWWLGVHSHLERWHKVGGTSLPDSSSKSTWSGGTGTTVLPCWPAA